jgi:hypothetical protein
MAYESYDKKKTFTLIALVSHCFAYIVTEPTVYVLVYELNPTSKLYSNMLTYFMKRFLKIPVTKVPNKTNARTVRQSTFFPART